MTEEEKEISAKAMFQVAMEAEHEVTALKKELKQRDETIAELKDEMHKKDVAFELITKQQYEQLQQLREALKWALCLVNNYSDNPSPETISKYKEAIKLIE